VNHTVAVSGKVRQLVCGYPWLPSPVDSILDAVLTVSPNKQYRGIVRPTTPAQHGPADNTRGTLPSQDN